MREGSLDAPVRHPLDWQNPDFFDEAKLDAEMRRVFDICHGCRRCFNLCDSFPRLFDLIDGTPNSVIEEVKSADFKPVVDACTLCDMCFMTKCPYVPPHAFNLDFPHLMLRARAVDVKKGKEPFMVKQLTQTDRNGKLGALAAPLANWAIDKGNKPVRAVMEKIAGVHREAKLPKFHGKTFELRARLSPPPVNPAGPAKGRKAALYATCFVNYNNPDTGMAAQAVLARNGVETKVVYPKCCGMPQLEQGEIAQVAATAKKVAAELSAVIDDGYDIVALMPSCALMLKFEWPLILPDDPLVRKLAKATFDISEYVVDIAKRNGGLAQGLTAPEGGVAVHIACHARAQNMGQKAAEMLRLVPGIDVAVIERCSGHGGSWGVMKENFETALKVGRPVARTAASGGKAQLVSECPLAGEHIVQGIDRIDQEGKPAVTHASHPIEILARAYGVK